MQAKVPRAGRNADELAGAVTLLGELVRHGSRWELLQAFNRGSEFPSRDSFASGTFTKTPTWTVNTAYTAGQFVYPTAGGAYIYECVIAGTSHAVTEPTWGTTLGANTNDAAPLVWRCRACSVFQTVTSFAALLPPGTPIRWAQNNVVGYGMVIGHSDTRMAVMGAPLLANVPIQAIEMGQPDLARMLHFKIDGAYGNSVADKLAGINNEYFRWEDTRAYLVGFAARHKTDAGTTQPYVNVKIGANGVSPNAAGLGIQPLAASWVDNSWTCIDTAIYTLDRGDTLEIACLAVDAGVPDASDLSVSIALVTE